MSSTATPLWILRAHAGAALVEPIQLVSVDCPNCDFSHHETVLVAEDRLTHGGMAFRIVRCRACQLAFTNPRPTAKCLEHFYPSDYSPHFEKEPDSADGRLKQRLQLALLRRDYGYPPQPTEPFAALTSTAARVVIRRTRARERWIPFRAPGRLLDFGCGAGEFVRQMRAYGWKAEGLDVSPRMVEMLRQQGDFPVHLGTLPHPDILPGSLDAITMWHSLEHVPFPQRVLQAAAHALRHRGVLGITVPNFDSWSRRQFHDRWFGLALPRHLTHFTPPLLRRMIEAAGFRVLLIEQVGRDGWLRKSARALAASDRAPKRLTSLRSKTLATLVARWTEVTGQADTFRLVAERR